MKFYQLAVIATLFVTISAQQSSTPEETTTEEVLTDDERIAKSAKIASSQTLMGLFPDLVQSAHYW